MLARLVSLQCADEHVYTLLGNNNSKPCYDPCTPMYGIHTSPDRAVGNHLQLVHCWKKKRDFQIIRSKVGGFLILSVADNEYFVS